MYFIKVIFKTGLMIFLYYMLGVFLSGKTNIMEWWWFGKLVFLFFNIIGIGNILENTEE